MHFYRYVCNRLTCEIEGLSVVAAGTHAAYSIPGEVIHAANIDIGVASRDITRPRGRSDKRHRLRRDIAERECRSKL